MKTQNNLIKTSFGIDISKDKFDAALMSLSSDFEQKTFPKVPTFDNNLSGFAKFLSWANAQTPDSATSVWFVMEATGVYYESLAHFLAVNQKQVAVVLPTRSKAFSASLSQKSKTDSIDALMLAQMGLERTLDTFVVPEPLLHEIKIRCRELQQIKKQKTSHSNQLHALKYSYQPPASVILRHETTIRHYDDQIDLIEKELTDLVNQNAELKDKIQKIITIKGVGLITVLSIVAETNGFALIENARQLTSYAGLDVKLNESGKFKGKTRISKAGNSNIRQALYFPAMSVIQFNDPLKDFYKRLSQRTSTKQAALIAVMRKLLILIYTLLKTGETWNPNYLSKSV